jgi:hypothetical protein
MKDETISKYQAALEALSDEGECLVWVTTTQASILGRLELLASVIIRALGKIGTATSIAPLSSIADIRDNPFTVYPDQLEAMTALAEICRRLAPTLESSILDSVRLLLEAAAQDSRNFVNFPAKRALARMSTD